MNMCSSVLSWSRRRGLWVASVVLLLVFCLPAQALMQDTSNDEPSNLLDNFIHYVITGQTDLAGGYGQALLDAGLTNADMALLVDEGSMDESRYNEAISWGQGVAEIEPIVSEIAIRVERGRLALARDRERIAKAIAMLLGNQRQELLAMNRLGAAGEYAVPQLLQQLTEATEERIKPKVERALVQIGKQAVDPLCVALPNLDSTAQRRVCDILAEIAYPHAAPALASLERDQNATQPVRQAARRAFDAVGGNREASLADLWADLGRRYFSDPTVLTAYPADDVNNIWSYDKFVGLVTTPVPTPIFGEVKAMQYASNAMTLEPANVRALSLFVAANLNRENDLPQGEDDPVFGDLPYSPDFFATVFGTRVCQDVLGMALDRVDTPLVRDAIKALSQTTGGANLFDPGTGRQPLLEALTYPDRRVQYEAALTLARALPERRFVGDAMVVPILASAVRTAGVSYGLVIANDVEIRQTMADMFDQTNFTMVGAEPNYTAAIPAIEDAIGIDLIVVQLATARDAMRTVDELRGNPRTLATPILVRVAPNELVATQNRYIDDSRVLVVAFGGGSDAFEAGTEQLLRDAVGGRLSDADAEVYAIESLSALRDVAINRSPAFRVVEAEPALLEAFSTRSGGMRMLVADILALLGTSQSQHALFDAALSETEPFDQVELLDRVAASVRKHGNLAERRHIDALVELIGKASGDVAEAAARVHGALNVFDSDAISLVPGN
ncbi:MAG: hypothetical protein KC983_08580 [Phycisphaerales bacterium]|nr:hypothetical protein [Phycisphaerales bacterium]